MTLADLRITPDADPFEALASTLGVPTHLLRALNGTDNRREAYRSFEIPKRMPGEYRVLHAPTRELKRVQRQILALLEREVEPHKCATAFRRRRGEATGEHGAVMNARTHCGKRVVFALDLEDFFPTILWPRVFGLLHQGPPRLPRRVAQVLANLCTTADGVLPQGAPTSPLLANLIAFRLDHQLYRWARANRCVYTRYADDLTFSTNHRSLSAAQCDDIEAIVREEGFVVNEAKRRTMPYYERQVVTGLVVNNKAPAVPRERLRSLRALLFNVHHFGWESQLDRGLAFPSRDAFLAYARNESSAQGAHTLRQRQRERHLLLDSASRIALPSPLRALKADRLTRFQQVVWGRIQFVAQVHGRDDDTYLELKQTFLDALRRHLGSEARPPRPPDTVQPSKRRSARRVSLELGYPNREAARKSQTLRRQAAEWGNAMRSAQTTSEQQAVQNGAAQPLIQLARATPGLGPLADDLLRLESEGDRIGLIGRVLDAVQRFSVHPAVTAAFCRAFSDEASFKTLLHSENDRVSVRAALNAAETHYRRFDGHLPPHLGQVTRELLNTIFDALDRDPGLHPYANPSVQPQLQSIKRSIRIDPDKSSPPVEGSDESVHLLHALRERVRHVETEVRKAGGDRPDTTLTLTRGSRRVFTDAVEFMKGVEIVLHSMVENAPSGSGVAIVVDQTSNRKAGYFDTVIEISSPCGPLAGEPSADAVLAKKGKLTRAYLHLAGVAWEWAVTGPFESGSYRLPLLSGANASVTALDAPTDRFTHHVSVRTLD